MKYCIFLALAALSALAADKKTEIAAKIIDRQYHEETLSRYETTREGSHVVEGATFTLQLQDGRRAVVKCDSKPDFQASSGILPVGSRSCRMPVGNDIRVEFDGKNAKLKWAASIDGKKTESETYQIVGMSDASRNGQADEAQRDEVVGDPIQMGNLAVVLKGISATRVIPSPIDQRSVQASQGKHFSSLISILKTLVPIRTARNSQPSFAPILASASTHGQRDCDLGRTRWTDSRPAKL